MGGAGSGSQEEYIRIGGKVATVGCGRAGSGGEGGAAHRQRRGRGD